MNKLDLIKSASSNASHKRQTDDKTPVKMLRQNQSFSITPEILDLVGSFKKGALSKAVQTALVYANKKGLLNDFKG